MKRKCIKCSKTPYHNDLCKNHFLEQIEKRVRKEIRLKKMFSKGNKVLVTDPVSEYIVRGIEMPLNIVKRGSYDKKVVMRTLDDEIIDFMKEVFEGKKRRKTESKANARAGEKGKKSKECLIFRTVKEDELEKFAKAKGLGFRKKKRTKGEQEIKKAIEEIEKRHAETKFSLLKSIEVLKD